MRWGNRAANAGRHSLVRVFERAALFGLLLMAVACGTNATVDTGAEEEPGTTTTMLTESTTSPVAATTTSTTDSTTTTGADMANKNEDQVRIAIEDLAARLGVAEGDIEMIEVRSVSWPDGSLGCPEEGKLYAQVVIEGTQILLGVDERIFDYHAGDDGDPFLCISDERDGGYEFVPPPRFDD